MTECDSLYEKARAAVLAKEEAGFKVLETRLKNKLKSLGVKHGPIIRNAPGHDAWSYGYRTVRVTVCDVDFIATNRTSVIVAEVKYYHARDDNGEIDFSTHDYPVATLADLENPLRRAKEQVALKAKLEAERVAAPAPKKRWWPFG